MNLPKFISLLQKEALFFYNLELMARLDPFEGALPSARFAHRDWNIPEEVPQEIRRTLLDSGAESEATGLERLKKLAERRIRQAYAFRRSYFVNCWHLSSVESAAMWEIYSRRDEGIAIVSSEDRIITALSDCNEDIYGGKIVYGDYSAAEFIIDAENAFNPILHKRLSFAYESEYRLAYWDTTVTHKRLFAVDGVFTLDGQSFRDDLGVESVTAPRNIEEIETLKPKSGIEVHCNIHTLIENVYVSPLAAPWFFDVVRNVSETYGLRVPIIRSGLLDEPRR